MAVQILAVDLYTMEVTEELPYIECSFTSELNKPGSWSVTLPLTTNIDGFEKIGESVFTVNRSAIVFLRDGVPLFMGWITEESVSVDGSKETVSIGGPSVAIGYLHRRKLSVTKTFTATDQINIANDIVAQSEPVGLLVEAEYDALSGVLRDRTYYDTENHFLGEILDDLSQLDDGFDYLAEVQGSQATGFTPIVRLGYPALLRRTSFVLDLDKNVMAMSRVVDGSQTANRVTVTGSSTGSDSALYAVRQDSTLWAGLGGVYPILDRVIARPTVINTSTLDSHARKYLRMWKNDVEVLKLAVDTMNHDSTPGSFRCGDEFRVIAKRGRLNIDSAYRVTTWSLSSDQNGAETMSMELVRTDLAT